MTWTADDELILNLCNADDQANRVYRQAQLKRWRANIDVINRLKSCGLWDKPDASLKEYIKYGRRVRVRQSDFPRLRRVFPQLKDTGCYELEDAELNTVSVWLDTGLVDMQDTWSVRLFYTKTLPEDGPCRVVYQEPRPTLVCNV